MKIEIASFIRKISKGPGKSFLIYWNAYGRKNALLASLYFWTSLFLAFLIIFVDIFKENTWQWQKDVISIIPTVFGFSVGGFAILIGFGNEKFREKMCYKKKDKNFSIYIKVNAAFFHFIFVQFSCLFYTILVTSLNIHNIFPFNFFGIFIFIYAIFTILAIAFAILRLARWFDMLYPPKSE